MVTSRLWDWDDNKSWGFPYEPEYEDIGEYCREMPYSQREILERRAWEVSRWLKCTPQKHHDTIKVAQVVIFAYAYDWEDWGDWEEHRTERYNLGTLVKKLRGCGYGGSDGQQKLEATVHLVFEYTTDGELVWAYGGSADKRCMEMKAKARKFFEQLGLQVEVTWKRMWSHDVSNCKHCRAPLQEAQRLCHDHNVWSIKELGPQDWSDELCERSYWWS